MDEQELRAELRAQIARAGLKIYQVGAEARISPNALSSMLRGRLPLTAARAERVLQAIARLQATRG